ncbi:DUF4912 domain-containing protein [Leptolyngbya sp. FACHB-711]|uniref:DUF4912 domain-containing protein n=1 Tax=unclassified Leptolyngbya TaxID=2650499 RepID=UPI0016867583|nr:DUF4912 domain-containing protein [Leptolyngbya sp. FACHB-711]MBD1850139.1 DUF4912 domain-containing protein [Cyanobacteria bacterium FACHB-502]MBD2025561.1 DUF4912 domain-containing protein [Leptolyngbya sp. FACHB-711]
MSTERPPIEEMTLRQLRRIASELGISRYSRMRKDQLLSSIQEIQRARFVSSSTRSLEAQAEVEAAKFDVGLDVEQTEQIEAALALAVVDEGLPELPDGYSETRIMLLPRDPQWAYAYWDIPKARKEELRQQGGVRLALRFYDVTDINVEIQRPHSLQQYECDELAREWYLPIPVSDRDYVVEIGYVAFDGRWLMLARSAPVRIPPVYPSDWIDDQFITVVWEDDLRGKTVKELPHPTRQLASVASVASPVYDRVFEMAQSAETQRVAGSVFGSMQQVPEEAISSYVFPSGVGKWAVPTASGMGMSGAGMMGSTAYTTSGMGMSGVGMGAARMSGAGMSGVGMMGSTAYTTSGMGMMSGVGMSAAGMSGAGMYTTSGMGMSGVGMYTTSGMGMSGAGMYTMSGMGMSGAGLSPSMRPRQFWLIADAELIVYGATEPDATVTIGGRPIQLNPDGTFRFQMSFQDGMIHFPIMAVAADGEQTRSVHLEFTRTTPERNTNTKEEAIVEWLP